MEKLPKGMMDGAVPIGGKPPDPGPNFFGYPIPSDWAEGLIMRIRFSGREIYSNAPLIFEAAIVAIPQAWEISEKSSVIQELRGLQIGAALFEAELTPAPFWWDRVIAKDFYRPNGKLASEEA